MTCVTRKEVERSEPFEKGLDLKSVWGHHFPKKSAVNHLISSDISPTLVSTYISKIKKYLAVDRYKINDIFISY